jgi:hypothetical protein
MHRGEQLRRRGPRIFSGLTLAIEDLALSIQSAKPDSTLLDIKGTLYGTTPYGGGANCPKSGNEHAGCGTIFAVAP